MKTTQEKCAEIAKCTDPEYSQGYKDGVELIKEGKVSSQFQ